MKNTAENTIPKGEICIQVYRNGKLIETIEEKNLVVTLGKGNMAKLMGGDATGKRIEKIAIGTSGIPANVADSAITGAFIKLFSNITYPDGQSVLFHFDIDNAEGNGITIREFGLLNADNILCARKARETEIVKTNAIRLVGTWKITIN